MPTVIACVGLLVPGCGREIAQRAVGARHDTDSAVRHDTSGVWTTVRFLEFLTFIPLYCKPLPNPLAVLRNPILGSFNTSTGGARTSEISCRAEACDRGLRRFLFFGPGLRAPVCQFWLEATATKSA